VGEAGQPSAQSSELDLRALAEYVDWPDSEASTRVREAAYGRPELGRFASLAEWVAGVAPGNARFEKVTVLIVDAEPSEAVAELADGSGAGLRPMTELAGGLAAGVAVADDEIERGTELLVLAAPTMAADAAVTVSILTDTEPVKVLARGEAATDPEAWMALAAEVRDRRRVSMAYRDDPDGLLAELNSDRLAAAAGVALRAAARRTPVLLDGPVATAAALIGYEAQPRAVRWWCAADVSSEPAHEVAHSRMGLRAVLELGTGLGDGLAGLLAVPVIRTAVRLVGG
jgi:nicotinate-nucleotide--dimethylbenzimidazole phosphoribosyltransferase